jgi:hypothetical protein
MPSNTVANSLLLAGSRSRGVSRIVIRLIRIIQTRVARCEALFLQRIPYPRSPDGRDHSSAIVARLSAMVARALRARLFHLHVFGL